MKLRQLCATFAMSTSLISCGGGNGISNEPSSPPDPNQRGTYNGNFYYAEATGAADLFVVPNLPAPLANQVLWNSIGLFYDTGLGTWTVAMNKPDYFPSVGHKILMGPFTGRWTVTPAHAHQYRVTKVLWRTGNADNANPVNGGVTYDIFQPTEPTGWIAMPPDSTVNVCSVSTNSVYTTFLGGGATTCDIEVMDLVTSVVTASTINLAISRSAA